MFTIEVKKRGKDEEFSFNEVKESSEVFHDDCCRGKVSWSVRNDEYDYGWSSGPVFLKEGGWNFKCERCNTTAWIGNEKGEIKTDMAKLQIVRTAVDSKKRQLSDDIRVVQKT